MRNGIDKLINISTKGGELDANLLWLQLTRCIHGLGSTEMRAAAIIMRMPEESYDVWRESIADELSITKCYVGVIMNSLRAKKFLLGDRINRKLLLPHKLPVNVLIRIE